MIKYDDILSLQYLSTQVFTGSYKGMRYRISSRSSAKPKEMNADNSALIAEIWPEPLCYEAFGPEKTVKQEFAFSADGRKAVIDWLNAAWQSDYSQK